MAEGETEGVAVLLGVIVCEREAPADHEGVGVGVGERVEDGVCDAEHDGAAAVPAGHGPQGHGCGFAAPPMQKKPARHCAPVAFVEPPWQAHPGAAVQLAHTSSVVAFTNVEKRPTSHGVGAPDAGGQKDPDGQANCVAIVEPAGQKDPAAHGPSHCDVLADTEAPQ